MTTDTSATRYNDLALRLVFALAAAHIVTEFGGNEPWLTRLFTKAYYIEFGCTLAITLLIVQMVYWATLFLDARYDWNDKPVQRALLQALLGIVAPALVTFALAAAYFAVYGINILDTNYHLYALPFIVALITIFNIYYLVRYLVMERARYRALLQQAASLQTAEPTQQAPEVTEKGQTKEAIIVHTPTRSFPVRLETIAYFYRDQNNVYLRLFEGGDHILSQSLDAIEEHLDERRFFRVARHMIASYEAIRGYHPLSFGKLGLTIRPAYKEPVNVSKPMAKEFKRWYDR